MTAKTPRTVKIDFTVRDGYDTIISEGFSVRADMAMPRALGVIEMRLRSLIDTAEYLTPAPVADPAPDAIESIVVPS